VRSGAVIGLDADPAILERARSKARKAGADVEFEEGFSTELPYGEGRFDVVLSTLLFHHLDDADKLATTRELHRVLKPQGRLVVADVGRPQDPLMRLAVMATVQLLDGRKTTSANVAGELSGMIENAGFVEVAVHDRLRTFTGTIEIITARRPPAGS
jgi:ubiquinone/menaquinone biosynthesis C-methylase UbiE